MNCPLGGAAFYGSYAGKEFPFEALYRGIALRFADQLPQTGEFASGENGRRCVVFAICNAIVVLGIAVWLVSMV